MKIRRKKAKYVSTAEVGVDTVADVNLPVLRIVIIPLRLDGLASLLGPDQLPPGTTAESLAAYRASLVVTGPHPEADTGADFEGDESADFGHQEEEEGLFPNEEDVTTVDQETQQNAQEISAQLSETQPEYETVCEADQTIVAEATGEPDVENVETEALPIPAANVDEQVVPIPVPDESVSVDESDRQNTMTDEGQLSADEPATSTMLDLSAPPPCYESLVETDGNLVGACEAVSEVPNVTPETEQPAVEELPPLADSAATSADDVIPPTDSGAPADDHTEIDPEPKSNVETDADAAAASCELANDSSHVENVCIDQDTTGLSDQDAAAEEQGTAENAPNVLISVDQEIAADVTATVNEMLPSAEVSSQDVDNTVRESRSEITDEPVKMREDYDVVSVTQFRHALPLGDTAPDFDYRSSVSSSLLTPNAYRESVFRLLDITMPTYEYEENSRVYDREPTDEESLAEYDNDSRALPDELADDLAQRETGDCEDEQKYSNDEPDSRYCQPEGDVEATSEQTTESQQEMVQPGQELASDTPADEAASSPDKSDSIASSGQQEVEEEPATVGEGLIENYAEGPEQTDLAPLQIERNQVDLGQISPYYQTEQQMQSPDQTDSAICTLTDTATSNLLKELTSTRVEQSIGAGECVSKHQVDAEVQTSRLASPRQLERVPSSEELSLSSARAGRLEMVVAATQTSRVQSAVMSTPAVQVASTTARQQTADGVTVTVHVQVNNPERNPNVINVNTGSPYEGRRSHGHHKRQSTPSDNSRCFITDSDETDSHRHRHQHHRHQHQHQHHRRRGRHSDVMSVPSSARSDECDTDTGRSAQTHRPTLVDGGTQTIDVNDRATSTSSLIRKHRSGAGRTRAKLVVRDDTPFVYLDDDNASTGLSYLDGTTERLSLSDKHRFSQDSFSQDDTAINESLMQPERCVLIGDNVNSLPPHSVSESEAPPAPAPSKLPVSTGHLHSAKSSCAAELRQRPKMKSVTSMSESNIRLPRLATNPNTLESSTGPALETESADKTEVPRDESQSQDQKLPQNRPSVKCASAIAERTERHGGLMKRTAQSETNIRFSSGDSRRASDSNVSGARRLSDRKLGNAAWLSLETRFYHQATETPMALVEESAEEQCESAELKQAPVVTETESPLDINCATWTADLPHLAPLTEQDSPSDDNCTTWTADFRQAAQIMLTVEGPGVGGSVVNWKATSNQVPELSHQQALDNPTWRGEAQQSVESASIKDPTAGDTGVLNDQPRQLADPTETGDRTETAEKVWSGEAKQLPEVNDSRDSVDTNCTVSSNEMKQLPKEVGNSAGNSCNVTSVKIYLVPDESISTEKTETDYTVWSGAARQVPEVTMGQDQSDTNCSTWTGVVKQLPELVLTSRNQCDNNHTVWSGDTKQLPVLVDTCHQSDSNYTTWSGQTKHLPEVTEGPGHANASHSVWSGDAKQLPLVDNCDQSDSNYTTWSGQAKHLPEVTEGPDHADASHSTWSSATKQLPELANTCNQSDSNHTVWSGNTKHVPEVTEGHGHADASHSVWSGDTKQLPVLVDTCHQSDSNYTTWSGKAKHVPEVTEGPGHADTSHSTWSSDTKQLPVLTDNCDQSESNYTSWSGKAKHVPEVTEGRGHADTSHSVWSGDTKQLPELADNCNQSESNYTTWSGKAKHVPEVTEGPGHADASHSTWSSATKQVPELADNCNQSDSNYTTWSGQAKRLPEVTESHTHADASHSVWSGDTKQLPEVVQNPNQSDSNYTVWSGDTKHLPEVTESHGQVDTSHSTWSSDTKQLPEVAENPNQSDSNYTVWSGDTKQLAELAAGNQLDSNCCLWSGDAKQLPVRQDGESMPEGGYIEWKDRPMQVPERAESKNSQDCNCVTWAADAQRVAESAETESPITRACLGTDAHHPLNTTARLEDNDVLQTVITSQCKTLNDRFAQTSNTKFTSQVVEAKPELATVDTETAVLLTDRSSSAIDFAGLRRASSKIIQTETLNAPTPFTSPVQGMVTRNRNANANANCDLNVLTKRLSAEIQAKQSDANPAYTEMDGMVSTQDSMRNAAASRLTYTGHTTRTSSVALDEALQIQSSLKDDSSDGEARSVGRAEIAKGLKAAESLNRNTNASGNWKTPPQRPSCSTNKPQFSDLQPYLSPKSRESGIRCPISNERKKLSGRRASTMATDTTSSRCSSGISMHSIGVGSAVVDWDDSPKDSSLKQKVNVSVGLGDSAEPETQIEIETWKPTILKMGDDLKNVCDSQTKYAEHLKVLSTNMLLLTRSDQVKKDRLTDLETRLRQVHDLYDNLLNGSDGEYDAANFTTPKSNVTRQQSAVSNSAARDRATFLPDLEPLFHRRPSRYGIPMQPTPGPSGRRNDSGLPQSGHSGKLALPVIQSTPMPVRLVKHVDLGGERAFEFPPIADRSISGLRRLPASTSSPRRNQPGAVERRRDVVPAVDSTPSARAVREEPPAIAEIEYSRVCAIM